MHGKTLAFAAVAAFILTGCVARNGFGGSGGTGGFGGSGGTGSFGVSAGSNKVGLALARNACVRDVRRRGQVRVRVLSSRNFGKGPAYARVILKSRRHGMTVNTNRWSCRFSYARRKTRTTRIRQ